MVHKPKLSVIVPVYNAESTLSRCVMSVINQEFSDFELLLVNDGSNDASLEICCKFSKLDRRVRVFSQPNGGVSSARNVGLDNAIGTWVMFVDSDDYLYEGCLIEMMPDDDNLIDLVIGGIYSGFSQTLFSLPGHILLKEDFREILSKEISHPCISSPCAKFFRKDLIEKQSLRFDTTLYFGEDSIFVKEYLLEVDSLYICQLPCYYYCDADTNLFYTKYNKNFDSIYKYYLKSLFLYQRLEIVYRISLSRENLVCCVFELMIRCIIKNGVREQDFVRLFLINDEASKILYKRKSIYIRLLLFLGQRMKSGYWTVKFICAVEYLRSMNYKILGI